MVLKIFSLLTVIGSASVVLSDTNLNYNFNEYCPLTCYDGTPAGAPNVFCNFEPRIPDDCIDLFVVPMDDLKKPIVDKHNEFRNIQALGLNTENPNVFNKDKSTAADMSTTSWDDELSFSALANVLKCTMEHDKCRATPKFKTAGQNLAQNSGSDPLNLTASAIDSVQRWWNEYKFIASPDEVKKLGSTKSTVAGKDIGHWRQVVQSKADRVGCAAVTYLKDGWRTYSMACNYGSGNMVGSPIYNIGPPASQCKTGKNPNYPGLCSEKENMAEHENGKTYFNPNATPTQVFKQWIQNGKQMNIVGGKKSADIPTVDLSAITDYQQFVTEFKNQKIRNYGMSSSGSTMTVTDKSKNKSYIVPASPSRPSTLKGVMADLSS